MAVANYESSHGHFPAPFGEGEGPSHSWRVEILPYIEGEDLHRAYHFDRPWDSSANHRLIGEMPNTYSLMGFEKSGPVTNYLAVVGEETVWPPSRRLSYGDLNDGSSQTILIVENQGAGIIWSQPDDLRFATMTFELGSPNGISSRHKTAAVVMADGSAHSLAMDTHPDVIRGLLTVDGGEGEPPGSEDGVELLPHGRSEE